MPNRVCASIHVMNDRVDFFCARAEHQGSEPNDAVTMHEDRWAYCAAGAAEPHDWHSMPAGGLSLDDAKHFVRRHAIHPVDPTAQRSD
jgi:hypothetical protein